MRLSAIENRDNVTETTFQTTIAAKPDRRQVYIEAEVQCGSPTIRKVVANGQAKFVLQAEYGGAFFHQAFPFVDSKTRIPVSATAVQDMNAYRVEKAYPGLWRHHLSNPAR